MAGSVEAGPAPTGKRYNMNGQLEDVPAGQSPTEPVFGAGQAYPTAGVDPSQIYGTAAGLKSQQEAEQATSALSKQNFGQSQQAIDNIFGKMTGVMGSGGAGNVTYGSGPTGMDPGALQKAQEAQFARAKDQAGLIGKSAITGLRDSMAARGTLGSGIEGEDTARVLNTGATQLGDVNRQQLEDALAGQTHAADTIYQGGITQRGQTLSAINGLLSAMASVGRAY